MYYKLISKELEEEDLEDANDSKELRNVIKIYIDRLTLKALENKEAHSFFKNSIKEIKALSKITGFDEEKIMKLFSKRILKYNKLHLTIALYQVQRKPDKILEALSSKIKIF